MYRNMLALLGLSRKYFTHTHTHGRTHSQTHKHSIHTQAIPNTSNITNCLVPFQKLTNLFRQVFSSNPQLKYSKVKEVTIINK